MSVSTAASGGSEQVIPPSTLRWYVPDAYIPAKSTPPEVSHESICVLNDADEPVQFTVTAYFADRDPQSSRPITLGPQRAVHLRTDRPDQIGGLRLERGIPYGMVIESPAPLQIQYSRLDTTQAAYSLMTALLTSSANPRRTD